MNKINNFKGYYALLHSEEGCSWTDLRKSYKSLIQKWHPDRFTDNYAHKEEATNKIKELNFAYQKLKNYYTEHGKLPLYEYSKNKTEIHSSMYTNSYEEKSTFSFKSKQHPQARTRNRILFISLSRNTFFYTITSIALLSYLWLDKGIQNNVSDSILTSKHQSNDSLTSPSSKTISTINFSPQKNNKHDTKIINKTPYFTHGSSIGEVISVQGAPDNIEGNIWFYGNSEVHFNNGVVERWIHNSSSPLHARITINPVLKEKNKKSNH